MKRVSVAEAKDRLPALLHDAESAPIEIVRRGRPVAVLVSRATFDRLRGKSEGVWSALQRFRDTHDLESLDAATAFQGLRDRSPGRPLKL
jgi:prevent-host-death family protein